MHEIILNKNPFDLNKSDLPLFIHGREKEGASFFTIVLTANLIRQGAPVVFWSAYPMAKETLRDELGVVPQNAELLPEGEDVLVSRLETLEPGTILVVKNCELLSEYTWQRMTQIKQLILSGDLTEKQSFRDWLINFHSRIYFSAFSFSRDVIESDLAKYKGIMAGTKSGLLETIET